MAIYIRRREVIFTLCGVAVASPLAAAQQSDRVRRIGMLIGYAESDAIRRGAEAFSARA